MTTPTSFKDRTLIAVIGDEVRRPPFIASTCPNSAQDSITGLLLAGVGHINEHQKKNFLVVDSSALASATPHPFLSNPFPETQVSTIETAFQEFTERKDVAILLINQHVRILPLCVGRHSRDPFQSI